MSDKTSKNDSTLSDLLNLLNSALELEYSLIIHYPRLASTIHDDEVREMVLQLGTVSIHHADIVANAITQLGGQPSWAFSPFPEGDDILHIFKVQLEKEKKALELHRQSANLVPSGPLANSLAALADEERDHIEIVNKIISKLARP
jgi:bacterioferritin